LNIPQLIIILEILFALEMEFIMPAQLSLAYSTILKAVRTFSHDEKRKLADALEDELLGEFDEYETSPELIKEINEARAEYKAGKYTTLRKILDNEI
jgi:hypothetical protein